MLRQILRLMAIVSLIAMAILYPFLPGPYDSLAVPLSTMAQAFGVFSVLVVPVGVLWLGYELSSRRQRAFGLSPRIQRYHFAIAAIVMWAVVAVAVSLVGYAVVGGSLGLISLVGWTIGIGRLIRQARRMKALRDSGFNPTPIYLIVIPLAVLAFQSALATPATQWSRDQAIRSSAESVDAIEAYAAQQGHYPTSLLAVWQDYAPSVVGIDQYHYEPNGDTYDLFFEQPRFLLDNLGTREWVVYNPRDRQSMVSHTSWILLLPPAELARNQGWYAVNDTTRPHWKVFWFD